MSFYSIPLYPSVDTVIHSNAYYDYPFVAVRSVLLLLSHRMSSGVDGVEEMTSFEVVDSRGSTQNREGRAELKDFQDHFSLPEPSSTVRFRKTATLSRIYPSEDSQFIIQDDFDPDGKRTIFAMKASDSTASLKGLRLTYTLVCAFWVRFLFRVCVCVLCVLSLDDDVYSPIPLHLSLSLFSHDYYLQTGFLFVLCLNILLFLILDLTIEVGVTSKQNLNFGNFLGTLLALPMFVHALASAMVIAGHYIVDTWYGHSLVKRFIFGRFQGVVTEWFAFFVFLGIPVFVLCVTMSARLVNFWEITSLAWFSCVCIFYILFAAAIVIFENRACLEAMKNQFDNDVDTIPQLLKRAILLRQKHQYSGTTHSVYLTEGAIDDGSGLDRSAHKREETHRLTKSWYSHIVAFMTGYCGGLGLFHRLDEPRRQYTYDDALGFRPFITANTWGLEKLYCRHHNSRYVAVLKGRDALTPAQVTSTLICSVIGNALVVFLVAAVLIWQGLPRNAVAFVVIVVLLFVILPAVRNSLRIYFMAKDLKLKIKNPFAENNDGLVAAEPTYSKGESLATGVANEGEEPDIMVDEEAVDEDKSPPTRGTSTIRDHRGVEIGDSEAIYQVWEQYRVDEATDLLCWLIFSLEVIFLFLYPTIALYIIGNTAIATVYFFLTIFTGLRTYLNAAVVLEEVGNLNLVDGTKGSPEYWQSQSRLSTIVANISRSKARSAWASILWVFLFALLGLFSIAINQSSASSSTFQFTYLPDFEYVQQEDLLYPTCTVGKGLAALGSPSTSIADYAFLAALAYRVPNITQGELDQWFGQSVAVDQQTFVEDFRRRTDNFTSAVSYKFITFPNSGNLGIVAIRGTTNAWDALSDAQLWSAAAVFQALRFLLPMGEIWDPLLHRVDNVISWLESATINRVAFYRQTTEFTNFLKTDPAYSNLQVTGHSLGGGLAIITGAQTGVAAVALSGPNAMISRLTFSPPLTTTALDTKTFNIIPDRDVVPRIDDVAKLHQNIRCTAPTGDFIGCHDGRRSLCEILHSCGTQNRPALCECVTLFNYPPPVPKSGTTRTFNQACGL